MTHAFRYPAQLPATYAVSMSDLDEMARRRVQAELDRLGWRATQLAARARISPRTMQTLLSGPAHWRLDFLDKVATAMHVDPLDLLRDPEKREVRTDVIELIRRMIMLSPEKLKSLDRLVGQAERSDES